jgi:hypothetical protein
VYPDITHIFSIKLLKDLFQKINLDDELGFAHGEDQSSGLSPNNVDIIASGYLAPFDPPTLSIVFLIFSSSSVENSTVTAAAFSFKYLMCLVPGIGMKS